MMTCPASPSVGNDQPSSNAESRLIALPTANAAKRPLAVAPPSRPVAFGEWRSKIGDEFPSLGLPAEVCASVFAQLLINDITNPCAVVLLDVPASGKTITLNFFSQVQELFYLSDTFTPASFVSHAANVSREKLAKVDLLPRVRYRVLVVPDLAPVFGAKDDDLRKAMGLLTRVFDGQGLETDSGVHGKRGYRGDYLFMMLAGSTPLPKKAYTMMGNMGARLLMLNVRSPDKDRETLIAQNLNGTTKARERACQECTRDFLASLWQQHPQGVDWQCASESKELLGWIADCATLLAAMRGVSPSETPAEDDANYTIEKPDRLNTLLYNLARGHALACGRTTLELSDLAPVVAVTLDSGFPRRSGLLRSLVSADAALPTSKVTAALGVTEGTALKRMKVLARLGVAVLSDDAQGPGRPEHTIDLQERYKWFRSDECHRLLPIYFNK